MFLHIPASSQIASGQRKIELPIEQWKTLLIKIPTRKPSRQGSEMHDAQSAIPYRPCGIWSKYDFDINRVYWEMRGVNLASDIRISNLRDVSLILQEFDVDHWLFGKTLLGAVRNNELIDDHDDDFGVYLSSRQIILSKIQSRLCSLGFNLIRNTDGIISFERHYRYIDICIFREQGQLIGYNKTFIDRKFLKGLDCVELGGFTFPIPENSNQLLSHLYKTGENSLHRRKLFSLRSSLKKLGKVSSLLEKLKRKHLSLAERSRSPWQAIFEATAALSGFSFRLIDINTFLSLKIEPDDSFNWRWRRRHLDPVTNGCTITRIGEIVDHLSFAEIRELIEASIEETDTSLPFHRDSNLDMRFWWGGNNYFWYCVKYQFRKNVVPYSLANDYISRGMQPKLYSAEYYEALPEMNEEAIIHFLRDHPIVIKNGCIVSGKHRVFAMVGRLASGKEYLPLNVIEIRD